jgi:hypothetical protein
MEAEVRGSIHSGLDTKDLKYDGIVHQWLPNPSSS